jgi:hypothetical protein
MTLKKLKDYIEQMEDPSSSLADNPFEMRSLPFRADSFTDLMRYDAASINPKEDENAKAFVTEVVSCP